jgi:hypothetical protein
MGAVPRADHLTIGQSAFSQRTTHMAAQIIQRMKRSSDVKQSDQPALYIGGSSRARWYIGHFGNLYPTHVPLSRRQVHQYKLD